MFNSWYSAFGDWSSLHPCDTFSTFHLTAGDDYETGPYTVSFSAGESYVIVMVSTVEDKITELSEYFKVVINSTDQPSVVEIGSPNMSFITIEDNDPGSMHMLNMQLHVYLNYCFVFLQRCGVHVCMHVWVMLCVVWAGSEVEYVWNMNNGSVQFPNSIDLIHIDTWQVNNISKAVSIHNCFFFICSCSSVVWSTELHRHWGWCGQHHFGNQL